MAPESELDILTRLVIYLWSEKQEAMVGYGGKAFLLQQSSPHFSEALGTHGLSPNLSSLCLITSHKFAWLLSIPGA